MHVLQLTPIKSKLVVHSWSLFNTRIREESHKPLNQLQTLLNAHVSPSSGHEAILQLKTKSKSTVHKKIK